jgi:type IV secretory pathway VirB3-like protein
VSGRASQLEHRWFGLTRSQLLWAVAVRVIVAAIAGTVVFVTTGSVIWLIVALLAAGIVVNALSGQRAARGGLDQPSRER